MSKNPPKNAMVERKCLEGYWENMTERSLEMLYKSCNPHTTNYPVSLQIFKIKFHWKF